MTDKTITPGPWKYKRLAYGWSLKGANGRQVDFNPDSDDAKLIGSAWQMHQALLKAKDELPIGEAMKAVLDALDAADGKGE